MLAFVVGRYQTSGGIFCAGIAKPGPCPYWRAAVEEWTDYLMIDQMCGYVVGYGMAVQFGSMHENAALV